MASAVSSIYEYPISAASAAYAPTNTSEVAAMIDSAVSGKLDASASSAFITSTADCQPSGDYVSSSDLSGYLPTSSIGVDSASAITSIAGSSIAGGGGATGDYVETTAQVVDIGTGNTSYASNSAVFIQGFSNENNGSNQIFAQGEGNYVNGNDCFAQGNYNQCNDSYSIAQGWYNTSNRGFAQGTNNLANIYSIAQGDSNTSEYYSIAQGGGNSASATAVVFGTYNSDGQGSGASGIALAFGDGTGENDRHNLFEFRKNGTLTVYSSTADTTGVELVSTVAGKLDASAIETSVDGITAIAGTALAVGGGGVVTATGTATAGDTAEPTTYVTSIDGMALSAANDTVLTATHKVTAYDPELSATSTSTATGTATGFSVVNPISSNGFGTASIIDGVKLNDGATMNLLASQLSQAAWQSGGLGSTNYPYFWLQFSPAKNSFPASVCTGYLNPLQYATGAGIMMSAGYFRGLLKANELFLTRENNTDIGTATNSTNGYYLRAEAHNSRGSHIGLTAARVTGTAYTGDSSECWTSTGDISQSGVKFGYTSSRASSETARNNYYASLTTAGISLSANWPTASAKTGMQLLRSSLTFTSNDSSESGTGTASTVYANTGITFEDSASTATMEKSSIDYWNDKLDFSAIETDSASAITGIAGSAIAGGGGTTYTAGQYIQISGNEISVTGIDPSSYVEKSAYDNLYSSFTSLSSYINQYTAYFGDLSSISGKLDASAIGLDTQPDNNTDIEIEEE